MEGNEKIEDKEEDVCVVFKVFIDLNLVEGGMSEWRGNEKRKMGKRKCSE